MNIYTTLSKLIKSNHWATVTGIVLGGIGLLLFIIMVIWVIVDSNLFTWFGSIDDDRASNIGGFIGGFVGVFISGAGFLLIYSTFQQQKKFNDNQDKFNTEQLQFSKEQSILNDKQQFETTFFNLLDTYRSLVDTMNGEVYLLTDESKTISESFSGFEYFQKVNDQLSNNPLNPAFINFIKENTDIPEVNRCIENQIDIEDWGL